MTLTKPAIRDKDARATFFTVDPRTGEQAGIQPREYGLNYEQRLAMDGKPEMLVQFAHQVEEELSRQGRGDLEVRAVARASLNGRERQLLVDPEADLSSQGRSLAPSAWILPLNTPLHES